MSEKPTIEDALEWAENDEEGLRELQRKLSESGRWGSAGENALEILAPAYRKLEKQLADAKAALAACREDSAELLAERGWWKDEPRAGYQKRYNETAENIVVADSILSPQ